MNLQASTLCRRYCFSFQINITQCPSQNCTSPNIKLETLCIGEVCQLLPSTPIHSNTLLLSGSVSVCYTFSYCTPLFNIHNAYVPFKDFKKFYKKRDPGLFSLVQYLTESQQETQHTQTCNMKKLWQKSPFSKAWVGFKEGNNEQGNTMGLVTG